MKIASCAVMKAHAFCRSPRLRFTPIRSVRKTAIHHFTEYLEQFPDDLEARWLLNLAHMTLGEHPRNVDPRYVLSIDHFTKSEFDIGRFRDVGHLAGVNRLNQSGGAIMDDFDNDGRLDLVVTAMGPTEPMACYHNKGDGSFEDRTESAGLQPSSAGWFAIRPIIITMDGWIFSSLEVPGSLSRSVPRSYATMAARSPTLQPRRSCSNRSTPMPPAGPITTMMDSSTYSSPASSSRAGFITTSTTAHSKRSASRPACAAPANSSPRERPGSITTMTAPRSLPQPHARDRRTFPQRTRRNIFRNHHPDADSRPNPRLFLLDLGLRQRRLARYLRDFL